MCAVVHRAEASAAGARSRDGPSSTFESGECDGDLIWSENEQVREVHESVRSASIRRSGVYSLSASFPTRR